MHPAHARAPGDFCGDVRAFGNDTPKVSERLHLFVPLPSRFDPPHRRRFTHWRQSQGLRLLLGSGNSESPAPLHDTFHLHNIVFGEAFSPTPAMFSVKIVVSIVFKRERQL